MLIAININCNADKLADLAKVKAAVEQLKKENPKVKDWSRLKVQNSNDEVELTLFTIKGLEDLSALKDTPLQHLSLQATTIKDISSLKGLKLKHLNLMRSKVSDISVLKGMPLDQLYLDETSITDLSPLQGMPLTYLTLRSSKVVTINTLKGLPLDHLDLSETNITDISPLSTVSSLKTLKLIGCKISNLSALKNSSLHSLQLYGCPVSDLSPLKGTPITSLGLEDTKVIDISPLKGMKLNYLELEGTAVTNISALSGVPLVRLSLPDTVTNVDVLRSIKTLKFINGHPPQNYWKLQSLIKKLGKEKALDVEKKLVVCYANMKQIIMACDFFYAGGNNGNYPPDLKTLNDKQILNDSKVYVCPSHTDTSNPKATFTAAKSDYVYLGKGVNTNNE
ncbi:MAG: hypothetical protein HRT89_06655, partial [Lentisphaeria bacterium]|nr:hypothetical protein [Lentisphaeria bacterium]